MNIDVENFKEFDSIIKNVYFWILLKKNDTIAIIIPFVEDLIFLSEIKNQSITQIF